MSKAFVVDTFNPREVHVVDTVIENGQKKAVIEFVDKPGLKFLYPLADVLVVAENHELDWFVNRL